MDQETPSPRMKPGPKAGSDGARRTGFAVDPERARRAGRLGAARVRELYGADHYGREHLAAIGKVGGTRKKAAADLQKALEAELNHKGTRP